MSPLKPLRGAGTDGFTIIELLVSMVLLAVVSTTFLAATNAIYNGIHKQQGLVDASDGNRRALQLLDKQVRYASAVNAPVTAADGNVYIEYQWSKSDGSIDTVTCSQWRLNPVSDILQWRSWQSGVVPSPVPVWTTVDTGVINVPATSPPFALGPIMPDGSLITPGGPLMQYQQLRVNLIARRDKGNVTSVSTFTALNTPSSVLPTTAVCHEVARS